jgi:hypothetical protein
MVWWGVSACEPWTLHARSPEETVMPPSSSAPLSPTLSLLELGLWGLELEILPDEAVFDCDPADDSLLVHAPCEP